MTIPLASYWSIDALLVNGRLFLGVLGAGVLGAVIGYERAYHGHAAGLRTYALVSAASAMVTAMVGLSPVGSGAAIFSDPTRIVQGVVTGIGFLCGGVIIKDDFTIRGLSTSASIWMTAAIGIAVGLGFHGAAIAATLLTVLGLGSFRAVEDALPHRVNVSVELTFAAGREPDDAAIKTEVARFGFSCVEMAVHADNDLGRFTYRLLLQASAPSRAAELMRALAAAPGLLRLSMAPSRN